MGVWLTRKESVFKKTTTLFFKIKTNNLFKGPMAELDIKTVLNVDKYF